MARTNLHPYTIKFRSPRGDRTYLIHRKAINFAHAEQKGREYQDKMGRVSTMEEPMAKWRIEEIRRTDLGLRF